MLPCGSQATSVGRAERIFLGWRRGAIGRCDCACDHFRPVADHHHDPPRRIELDDHVGPLVHGPDVVLRIDAHGVGKLEAVVALAEFADVDSVLIELEQARVGAAREDKYVSLGVRGHAHGLAHIQAGGELEKVRYRIVGDLRNILRFGLVGLREDRAGDQQRRDDEMGVSEEHG